MVDGLDMWLTAGRYAEQFSVNLAEKFGAKFAHLPFQVAQQTCLHLQL